VSLAEERCHRATDSSTDGSCKILGDRPWRSIFPARCALGEVRRDSHRSCPPCAAPQLGPDAPPLGRNVSNASQVAVNLGRDFTAQFCMRLVSLTIPLRPVLVDGSSRRCSWTGSPRLNLLRMKLLYQPCLVMSNVPITLSLISPSLSGPTLKLRLG
jgi:hypothetical protein